MIWSARGSFKHKHPQLAVRSTCQLLQLSQPLSQTRHNKQRRRLERPEMLIDLKRERTAGDLRGTASS